MPAISIIVPVYRTEKYLHRCIDSILGQTFVDFECIIIDDGSPDNCPDLCDEYAVKDSRIVVIHQKNAGVSAARNAGLDIARGKWIGFVDSDDWCDHDMFSVLYNNAVKYDADISICGWRKIYNNGRTLEKVKNKLKIFNGEQAIKKLFTPSCNMEFNPSNWNKLFNAKIIFQNGLRYDTTIQFAEDFLFQYEILKHTRRVVSFSMPYYNYICNPESVTNQYGLTDAVKTQFFAFDKMILLEDAEILKRKIIVFKIILAYNLCHNYIVQKDYTNKDFYFLKKLIVDNRRYLLYDFATPLHIKMKCCMVSNPYLYFRARNILKSIKKILCFYVDSY